MKRVILFLFVAFAFLVSCDEPDGLIRSEVIKWETNLPHKGNNFDVQQKERDTN